MVKLLVPFGARPWGMSIRYLYDRCTLYQPSSSVFSPTSIVMLLAPSNMAEGSINFGFEPSCLREGPIGSFFSLQKFCHICRYPPLSRPSPMVVHLFVSLHHIAMTEQVRSRVCLSFVPCVCVFLVCTGPFLSLFCGVVIHYASFHMCLSGSVLSMGRLSCRCCLFRSFFLNLCVCILCTFSVLFAILCPSPQQYYSMPVSSY